MKHINLLLISLVVMLLAGCNTGGPSNAEAKEVIYGVYFLDAKILEKRQCELTPQMEKDGVTNVWLIRYQTRDDRPPSLMLLSEGDSEEYPWMPYITSGSTSREFVEESCP